MSVALSEVTAMKTSLSQSGPMCGTTSGCSAAVCAVPGKAKPRSSVAQAIDISTSA